MENKQSSVLQPLIYALVAVVGMVFGMRLQSSLESDGYLSKKVPTAEQAITETIQHVQTKYYGSYDSSDASDRAIRSYLLALDDNTRYFQKNRHVRYKNFVDGFYRGYGVEFLYGENELYIKNVLIDSPADIAGLKKWDRVQQIENRTIEGTLLSPDSIQSLISDSERDSIIISVGQGGDDVSTFTLIKGKVKVPIVRSYWIADSTILYVDIDRFSNSVFSDFMSEIDYRVSIHEKPIKYIIDLRDNPGGAVDETVKIINQFVDQADKTILSTVYKNQPGRTYKSTGKAFLKIGKVAVLIDRNSASSSEIVAGVLQDMKTAKVFGSPSFGKGSIQQNYELSNQGSLQLTVGNYILPSGKKISKSDSMMIQPDFLVDKMRCLDNWSYSAIGDLVDDILLQYIDFMDRKRASSSVPDFFEEVRSTLDNLAVSLDCKEYIVKHIQFEVWKSICNSDESLTVTLSDPEITMAAKYLLE